MQLPVARFRSPAASRATSCSAVMILSWLRLLLLLPGVLGLGEGGSDPWDYRTPHYPPGLAVATDYRTPAMAQERVDPGSSVAQDRMDPGIPEIDAALLRQVLEDPALLAAVDPQVLQRVLVQAATANLLTLPGGLPSTTSTTPRPPPPPPRREPPPFNPQPLLPPRSLAISSSNVENLPHRLDQIQVDLPNLEVEPEPALQTRPPRRTPSQPVAPAQSLAQLEYREPQFSLDSGSLAQALRDHPDIATELARRLAGEPGLAAELGLAPTVRQTAQLGLAAPVRQTTEPPPHCPEQTPSGQPCGPGLAYSHLSRACEWPDTLMDEGCNPEVITGFGPCPQDPRDPHLTDSQVAAWPRPKFPLNLDMITLHQLSSQEAGRHFIVCTPTRYGRLFPRLTSCPAPVQFSPSLPEGCPAPPPAPQPAYRPIPPPTYGSPEPQITHIGAPLPLGAPRFGGFPSIISGSGLQKPAIELEDEEARRRQDTGEEAVMWDGQ